MGSVGGEKKRKKKGTRIVQAKVSQINKKKKIG